MRKAWIGAAVLVVCGLLVWLFWGMGDLATKPGDERSPDTAGSMQEPEGAGLAGRHRAEPSSSGASQPAVAKDPRKTDPEGDLVLEGQVLDPEGLPVDGAQVTLQTRPERPERGMHQARTGRVGTFAFERLIPRSYSLTARKDDLAGGPVTHRLTANSEPVIIRLRSSATVRVEVTEAGTRTPVTDAEVTLVCVSQRRERTGPDGAATFRGVPGGGHSLQVNADGFAPQRRSAYVPEQATRPVTFRFLLHPGAMLSGRVLAPDASPAAGAEVWALAAESYQAATRWLSESALSDERGEFRFAALASGTYRLVATHPTHAQGAAGPVFLDGVHPVAGLEIRLKPGARVAGRVVDEGGRTVGFAGVRHAPPLESPKRRGGLFGGAAKGVTFADSRGAFEVLGLPREPLVFTALADGALSDEVKLDLAANPIVEDVELVVGLGGRIAGVVVDREDRPQAEATVTAMADFEDGTMARAHIRSPYRQCQTDGAGRFALTGLVDGTYRLQAAQATGQVDWTPKRLVKAKTGDEDVRLVLDAPGRIAGRVRFADGTSPARFEVGLAPLTRVVFEGTDGAFELGRVPPGAHELTVRGEGFVSRTVSKVEVEPSETTDLGTVQVDRGRQLSGRVLEPDGAPVAGALVAFGRNLPGDGSHLVADTPSYSQPDVQVTDSDRDGLFELFGVGPKGGVIAAEHDRKGRSLPEVVPHGEGDVEVALTLRGVGSLGGTIRVRRKPAPNALVFVRSKKAREQEAFARTAGDGQYLFSRLADGEYSLVAHPPGIGVNRGDALHVTVRAGEHTQADLDLAFGDIDLELTVTSRPGARLDAAWVYLLPGQVQASTGQQVREAMRRIMKNINVNFCAVGKPCMFIALQPRDYSLCAIPITGDTDSGPLLGQLMEHFDSLAVLCSPIEIRSSPEVQSHTIALPSMPPLPEE